MGMTVGRVYWLFDSMVTHIRLTNPFGSGDENGSTDVATQQVTKEQPSGFGLANAVAASGLNRGATGIQAFKSIDEAAKVDPDLADFARAFNGGLYG